MEGGAGLSVTPRQESPTDPLTFARSYQLEALEKATKENTIVYLDTGSGKTLIAIMLLRHYAHFLRKPSPFIAVFLVPTVVLVTQQAEAVKMHTDLEVGKYWGEMGVDFWDAATWKNEIDKYEVFVMTPQILLDALRHSYLKLDIIKVLIFDECHNARGRSPYACILMEFYHRHLCSDSARLPRIFGMTASPMKTKGACSPDVYKKHILELESLMNSKVYTVANESVLAEFIPFSNTKLKLYHDIDFPCASLSEDLQMLKLKHVRQLKSLDLDGCAEESAYKKISKLCETFMFCLKELGVWLALKAAETLSCSEAESFFWGQKVGCCDKIIRNFSQDVFGMFSNYLPSGSEWAIGDNLRADVEAGFLTTKVCCLIKSLLEYRTLNELRCIIFVERVITAVVLQALLTNIITLSGWKTRYMAGSQFVLLSQTRKDQMEIVEAFREGTVNIIVATQILEEGLDVQSCNLVVRFDPSTNVCSFIQSRGRARMRGSDYLLIVKSEDTKALSKVKAYLASGDIMREQALQHASLPCAPFKRKICDEDFYEVRSTGAIVTLSSSVALIYFYCSRLPSDGYFSPAPTFLIDKDLKVCTLHLPKSCPIQTVSVHGKVDMLKPIACLEACKQLHKIGALTDNLIPEIVVEEADAQEYGNISYDDKQVDYFPCELVTHLPSNVEDLCHCYSINLKQNIQFDFPFNDIVLVSRSFLERDVVNMGLDLQFSSVSVTVNLAYAGTIHLSPEQVLIARRFQITTLRLLIDPNLSKLKDLNDRLNQEGTLPMVDYLLLPSNSCNQNPVSIDWACVRSALFPSSDVGSSGNILVDHVHGCYEKGFVHKVQTKSGVVCRCMLMNSLVCTPHTGSIYCINGILDDLDGNSLLKLRNGNVLPYKEHYQSRHGIKLCYEKESLLSGRRIYQARNSLHRQIHRTEKEPSCQNVELPPELCSIIMSPISISTFYSFSFIPSIMHRLESMLLAYNLKKMQENHYMQNVTIPTIKILEAITTKKCQEEYSLESFEILGDSFLKYAASQHLFIAHKNKHEGLLSVKKDKIVSNAALCNLGCERGIPGFIRNDCFDPKQWVIPGDNVQSLILDEVSFSTRIKVYSRGRRHIKRKTVADAVEALIGAYLSTCGEAAALSLMNWLGIKVEFVNTPHQKSSLLHPEKYINISHLESLLNYSFRDPSLLVEALTHGSYMHPEIPRCYQRLEFLGDSVLDYLITTYHYNSYPGISPGLLTDLRSASVNNDCFAQSAIKFALHNHILHASSELHKHITIIINNFKQLSSGPTSGWESETFFPKVLGDIIESIAGAIFVDSGYNKDIVWRSIRPLLEPMVTPDTVRLHPVRELEELCRRRHLECTYSTSYVDGVASITVEVKANGVSFCHTCTGPNKKAAKKEAARSVLKKLKENISGI